LAALNYVRFDPHDDGKPRSFMAGLRGLVRALKSDLGWLREHTRLLIRATEWNEAGRPGNRLLTGEAVVEAKAWAARRPKDAPALNALHLDFLAASEAAEIARQSDAQRQIEERERLLAQAEKAAREREETTKQAEAAVERERAALRTSARMQRVATGLLIGIVAIAAGVIGWANHAKLNDLYMWQVTMRGPFLSTAAQHSVRRPGEVFAECAKGCPQMVVIPEGKFKMGASQDEQPPYDRDVSSYPQHDVTIPNPIAVGRYTVTFEEYDLCVQGTSCREPRSDKGWGRGRQPVINISWEDAQTYVQWLSRLSGAKYRLLSEAEWEYAARAGTQTAYSWGDDVGHNQANCNGCGSKWDGVSPAPVGSFPPNAFGLYDMLGNVWQYVEDNFICRPGQPSCGYDGKPEQIKSTGGAWLKWSAPDERASEIMARGGSYDKHYGPQHSRSAARGYGYKEMAQLWGFRVARDLGPDHS
jgi:formylglycine-generating enzyme required for sulfatase activity